MIISKYIQGISEVETEPILITITRAWIIIFLIYSIDAYASQFCTFVWLLVGISSTLKFVTSISTFIKIDNAPETLYGIG